MRWQKTIINQQGRESHPIAHRLFFLPLTAPKKAIAAAMNAN
jgi:hypothetical protein